MNIGKEITPRGTGRVGILALKPAIVSELNVWDTRRGRAQLPNCTLST